MCLIMSARHKKQYPSIFGARFVHVIQFENIALLDQVLIVCVC